MGSVSVSLIGATRLTNVSEASGTYWHISLLGGNRIDFSKAVFSTGQAGVREYYNVDWWQPNPGTKWHQGGAWRFPCYRSQ
jgi:hypothetical protein